MHKQIHNQTFYDLHITEHLGLTKETLANQLYPSARYTWDAAIPESWITEVKNRGLDLYIAEPANLASHFVTVYPKDGSQPFIGPLSQIGIQILGRLL